MLVTSHLLVCLLGWQEAFATHFGSEASGRAVTHGQAISNGLATDVDRDSTAETNVHPGLMYNRGQHGTAGGWLQGMSGQLAKTSRLITDRIMQAASGIRLVWKTCYAAPAKQALQSNTREVGKPSAGWLHSLVQKFEIQQKMKFQAPPTVAFLVLGWPNQRRPPWSRAVDSIVTWSSPQTCQDCSNASKAGPAARMNYPKGWWCAQRHYWDGLARLMNEFPDKDYYFLADSDTLVFPEVLDSMMTLLENDVLSKDEDLYMGDVHCYLEPCHGTSCNCKNPFVASGGGVLVRGKTMRKLQASGHLGSCATKAFKEWCWHHLDWAINECMSEMGVQARFHKSFQQFSGPWQCPKGAVACHPVKTQNQRERIWAQRSHETLSLNAAWARPDKGTSYTGEIGPPVFPPEASARGR